MPLLHCGSRSRRWCYCRAAARGPAAAQAALLAGARQAAACVRGRCCSRATTCYHRRRWPPASTTTCATAPRPAGTPRRARGERVPPSGRKRALDVLVAVIGLALTSPLLGRGGLLNGVETTVIRLRQRRMGKAGCLRPVQTADDGERRRDDGLRARGRRGRRPHHPVGACCAAPRSTSCRTSSTCCAGRCRSSARAPPSRCRSTATRERQRRRLDARPGHHGLGAGQRPRVAALARRIELDLWYLDTPRCGSTCLSSPAASGWFHGHGLYRGETGGWREPPAAE